MNTWTTFPFEDAIAVLFDFGGVSRELLASKNSVTDLNQVWEKLHIRLLMCDIDEMLRHWAPEAAAVEALASQWEQGAQHVTAGTEAPIRANARLFLAIQQELVRTQARAAAINCHAMPQHALQLPCVAMVELHRTGVLVACEMDLNGLLSSMLLTHLAGRPAFMGNVIPRSDTTVDIEHCVAPPDMLPELGAYAVEGYHGTTDHATVVVALPDRGVVTLARIAPDLERVHCVVGQIVGPHHTGSCRNSLTVRIPSCQAFLDEKLGGHYALVCGDVSAPLSHKRMPRV